MLTKQRGRTGRLSDPVISNLKCVLRFAAISAGIQKIVTATEVPSAVLESLSGPLYGTIVAVRPC